MATKDRPADRGRRDAATHIHLVGHELREARIAAGLSQENVARAVGSSHAAISRMERGLTPNVPLARIDLVAAVVGMRLSIRLFPAGQPLRDAGQLALLERFRRHLAPGLTWRTEVPIPLPSDLRAWDASVGGAGWMVFVDAETRIRDVQALERRTALKRRDTGTDRVVLLIADSRSNRAVLRSLGAPLVENAMPGSVILTALGAGRDPLGSGVVLL